MTEERKESIRVDEVFALKEGKCASEYKKHLFSNKPGRVLICLINFDELEGVN